MNDTVSVSTMSPDAMPPDAISTDNTSGHTLSIGNNVMPLKPRQQRGSLSVPGERYGLSLMGAPLLYFPSEKKDSRCGLVLAGTHGDETASIVTLSCALRSLLPGQRHQHVVLAVNPDGCQLGLRANANGVDINRNFACANWQDSATVYRWSRATPERDVKLSTGTFPGSEPETQALCALIERLRPAWVVSFHEPLACVDDPGNSSLGRWLSQAFSLPQVRHIGYDTPGSFGSWCAERQLPCITLELPAISADDACERYFSACVDLLQRNFLYQCS